MAIIQCGAGHTGHPLAFFPRWISEWPVTQFLSLSHAFWPVRTSTVPSVWCSGQLIFLLFTRLARARSPRPHGRFENPTTRCKVRALYFYRRILNLNKRYPFFQFYYTVVWRRMSAKKLRWP